MTRVIDAETRIAAEVIEFCDVERQLRKLCADAQR